MTKRKTDRQEFQWDKFVTAYLAHGDGTRAAVEAGYSEASADSQACVLLLHNTYVRGKVEAARAKIQAKGVYNLEKAMREADDAIEFARSTKNANAYVKAVELKSKLNGLLVEKHEVKQVGFQIQIRGVNEIPQQLPSMPDINILPEPKKPTDESVE